LSIGEEAQAESTAKVGHLKMNMHVPALQRSLPDVVAEYDTKAAAIDAELQAIDVARSKLRMSATIGGTYGNTNIDVKVPYASSLREHLLRSAWLHVFDGLQLDRIATADDKRKWKTAMENPVPFTLDNIRATFGHYIENPRVNILRGLAEVFCQLDQAYKSHDKVKIGVKGLPKRIIVGSVGYSDSYGRQKLRDMFNALAAYRGEPLTEYKEFDELDKLHSSFSAKSGVVTIRGIEIKKYLNGNAHVMFDKASLRDINKALAEFYGDVLPDTTDEKPAKKQASTAISKDLQYYATPAKVIDDILRHKFSSLKGKRGLEPSCGDGRILAAMRRMGCTNLIGVEVDYSRAVLARANGFKVVHGNFLDTAADQKFDIIVMNPPFYGKHYAKHVLHAWSLLAPGGTLIAILPATARYDHGLLDELIAANGKSWSSPWEDLPVGSFSESGTNINTTVLTVCKREEAK
jgi:hypothetical protein